MQTEQVMWLVANRQRSEQELLADVQLMLDIEQKFGTRIFRFNKVELLTCRKLRGYW